MKTPVLIAENAYWYSGSVTVSINIGMRGEKVGIYPTLTTGKILDKISKGVWPDVTLWKGGGFTWGGATYYFHWSDILSPLKAVWAWIWARPIYRVWKVYYCYCYASSCEYIGDDVESFTGDVLTSGYIISDLGRSG